MRTIELTDEELLTLDGKVNAEAQKVIDNLKIVNTYSGVGGYAFSRDS